MTEQDGGQRPGRVTIENVNHPGTSVHGGRRHVPRHAGRASRGAAAGRPACRFDEMLDAVAPRLPDDLFPGGAKAGWWAKSVQLDLEAKGVIARESSTPLRWHRNEE